MITDGACKGKTEPPAASRQPPAVSRELCYAVDTHPRACYFGSATK